MSGVPQETLDQLGEETAKLAEQRQSMMGASGDEQETEETAEAEEGEEQEDQGEDEPNTTDPDMEGFMTYEEYVEAGYDPEFYRGPKAYKQQKQILAEKKQVEQKLKQIDDQMLKLTKFHEREKERLLKEIESQQKQAKEEVDFDRYEELEKQKRQIEEQDSEQQQQEQGEHPAIAEFRQQNPKYDPRSPDYDPVDEAAFKAAYNAMVQDHYNRTGQVSDDDIQRLLGQAKRRFEGKQAPERQQPKSPRVEAPRRKAKKDSPSEKLPPEVKAQYEKWAKSKDPEKQEWGKQLLESYKGD